MAAPSPRSHRCRSQPGCGTAPAPPHGSRHSPGRGGAVGRGWGAAARPRHPKEPRPPPPCRLQVHTKGSVIHPHTHKNRRPPPHARRTLHGDGRVALLRVLGALHLQLLGRERPIRAARGGQGRGSRSWGPPQPFLHPDISPWPQPGRAGGHTRVLGEGVWVPAWLGAALAVPSSWDMVVMPPR